MQPQLIYSTNEHGCSLISFFMMAEKYEPTILLVKTCNKEVFGAYCSGSWMERREKDDSGNKKTYFATGESFLFTLTPTTHKFPWIGIKNPDKVNNTNQLFMMATEYGISIGGGDSHGLWLDKDLAQGKTGHCLTFDNPSLVAAAHNDFSNHSSTYFTCAVVEGIARLKYAKEKEEIAKLGEILK
ncbi:TBC1 domain family member 24 [Nymphon striatum]|nr:TBC1 domain family member 24 [Nymphon striatum]